MHEYILGKAADACCRAEMVSVSGYTRVSSSVIFVWIQTFHFATSKLVLRHRGFEQGTASGVYVHLHLSEVC